MPTPQHTHDTIIATDAQLAARQAELQRKQQHGTLTPSEHHELAHLIPPNAREAEHRTHYLRHLCAAARAGYVYSLYALSFIFEFGDYGVPPQSHPCTTPDGHLRQKATPQRPVSGCPARTRPSRAQPTDTHRRAKTFANRVLISRRMLRQRAQQLSRQPPLGNVLQKISVGRPHMGSLKTQKPLGIAPSGFCWGDWVSGCLFIPAPLIPQPIRPQPTPHHHIRFQHATTRQNLPLRDKRHRHLPIRHLSRQQLHPARAAIAAAALIFHRMVRALQARQQRFVGQQFKFRIQRGNFKHNGSLKSKSANSGCRIALLLPRPPQYFLTQSKKSPQKDDFS